MKNFLERSHELVDARQLAIFRMVFGAAMVYQMVHYMGSGLVESGLMAPKMLFTYEGFHWLQPFSTGAMHALVAALALSGACIFLGLFTRAASAFFGVGFLYILLLDKSLFNNHLYLFCLIAILFACMPTDRVWSLRHAFFGKERVDSRIPRWAGWLLCAQIFIVYFYGGIAKLNADWLTRQEPMRSALLYFTEAHPAMGFLSNEPMVYLFNYGGLAFDLLIGFMLLWRPVRSWALLLVAFFNITNHFLFDDIGVFPFVMLPATLLFFSPEEVAAFLDHRGWRLKAQGKRKRAELPSHEAHGRWPWVRMLIGAYLVFQLLFPLRWLLMPGNTDWTSIGQRFSWRMKSTVRVVDKLEYYLTNDAGERGKVAVDTYLNTLQIKMLAKDPRMIIDFAKFLLEDSRQRGIPVEHVTTVITVRYNGRAPLTLYPPELDVAALDPGRDPRGKWIPELQRK
jgi:hypothetical protein